MRVSAGYVVSIVIPESNDPAVLIVGKQTKGKMDIVNAFSGEEAIELGSKLLGAKESNRLLAERGEST